MLTIVEAMQRMRTNEVRLTRDAMKGGWIVTLNEWQDGYNNPDAYHTDDLEDAVLMGANMRAKS